MDKGRIGRVFKLGDWVFLILQAYKQLTVERKRSAKISPRYFDPYEVLARVEVVAYTLKLPEGSKVHPTFHVSLLKKCSDLSIPPVHLPMDLGMTSGLKEPAEVLDFMIVQKKGKVVTEALIRWQGKTFEDATWELRLDLQ